MHFYFNIMSKSLRLRLDVDIGDLSIELASIPNLSSIGIRLQYQNHCLDVDEFARWNRKNTGCGGCSHYPPVRGGAPPRRPRFAGWARERHKVRELCGEGRREAAPRLADGGRMGPAQLSGGRREKDGVARLAWWRKDGGGDGTSGGRMRSVEDGVRRA